MSRSLLLAAVISLCLAAASGDEGKKETPQEPFAFRVHLGLTDTKATTWSVSLTPHDCEITDIVGWRFSRTDSVTRGKLSAKCRTRGRKLSVKDKKDESIPRMYPIGVDVFVKGRKDNLIDVKGSPKSGAAFDLKELTYGAPLEQDKKLIVERIPAVLDMTTEGKECDEISIGVDTRRTVWVSRIEYGEKEHRLVLTNITKSEMAGTYEIAKSPNGFLKPITTIDGGGRVWVIFGMETKGDVNIYARHMNAGQLLGLDKVAEHPGPDINHSIYQDEKGKIWVVWQSARNGNYDIFMRHVDDTTWSAEFRVTETPQNEWAPAVCADKDGAATIVYDIYQNGDYDIAMKRFVGDKFEDTGYVTQTAMNETHASLVCDTKNRIWIAWEEGPGHWGAAYPTKEGAPLHAMRKIRYKVLDTDGEKTAGPLAEKFPYDLKEGNEGPRLAVDKNGYVWMAFRHLAGTLAEPSVDGSGPFWESYVTYCTDKGWQGPIPLPLSAGGRDQVPHLYMDKSGDNWLAWSSDGREYGQEGVVPIRCKVYVAKITAPKDIAEPQLEALPAASAEPKPLPGAGVRYATRIGQKDCSLVFGDLNRQTENSIDAKSGWGTYDDLFRYALDAAGLHFVGVADNFDDLEGALPQGTLLQRALLWRRAQELVRAGAIPTTFVCFYGYRRVHRFPMGRRLVVMETPSVPPVGLFYSDPKIKKVAEDDTKRLWEALKKEKDARGLTIPLTPADQCGTDWADVDPSVEPVVEIYSGTYGSYEQEGAPLVEQRGAKTEGFVAAALAKKIKLGFVAGSGESSTGRAFTGVYADEITPKGIFDALLARRTYAATDKIILEYRVGDHFMGEVFTISGKPKFEIRVIGANEIKEIAVIKDNQTIHTTDPDGIDVAYEFTDDKAESGKEAFYYIRVTQNNGATAWASPVWITVK